MKKLFTLTLLLLICTLSQAAMFGLTEDFVADPDKFWLLQKVVSGKPIKCVLYIDEDKNDVGAADKQTALLKHKMAAQKAVVEALNSWFLYTKQEIKKSGHQTEFQDILAIISNPIRVELVSDETKADLIITFTSLEKIKEKLGTDTLGYANGAERVIFFLYLRYNKELKGEKSVRNILTHELGHLLGLADQYEDADNASPIYSTSHRVDSRYTPQKESLSIMGNKYSFGCDDADAVVYAIDYLLNHKKPSSEYTARVKAGWKSFCQDNTTVKDLKVLDKKPYISKNKFYRYYKEGSVKKVVALTPFVFQGRELEYIKKPIEGANVLYHFGDLTDNNDELFATYVLMLDVFENPTWSAIIGADEQDPIKDFDAVRVEDPAGDYWEIPYGMINPIQVYPKKNMCSEISYDIPIDYFEYNWIDVYPDQPAKLIEHYTALFDDKSYSGMQKEIFGDLKEDIVIAGARDKENPTVWKCSLRHMDSQDNILLIESNGEPIILDEKEYQRLRQKMGVSQQQLESAVWEVCRGK